MKKFLTAFLLILCLCLAAACAEEPAAVEEVTAGELVQWAGGLKARGLETEPDNDPTDESADVEGGIMFLYPFATLYADQPEMTMDTHINAVTIAETEEASFRDITLSMTPGQLIALFPNDNPEMAGTRDGAVLYLRETDDGALRFGQVYRDGQRVSAVVYGDLVPAADQYYLATLTCAFSEGLLCGISAEGFDGETAPLLTQEERDALAQELNALASETEYRAVKSSRDGTELTPFGPEDLVFSGFDFLSLQPADLPGTPESEVMDNGDGTSLLRVDGDGYSAVFMTGADGTTQIVSLSLLDDMLEGPRGVRLGDAFHEDFQRFRSEPTETDGEIDVLYGTEETVPRGTSEYTSEGLTLRYVTAVPDGREVELLLHYNLSRLDEIILYIR